MSGSEYYNHTTYPTANSLAASATMRAELELVESGFGKLPDLSGNGSKVVVVNSGGTALEAVSSLTVAQGGTGRATGTTAYALIAAGTTATGAQQTLAAGATTELLVGGGTSSLPVWTAATGSGAPVRATSPTLVTPDLGTPSAVVLTNATGTAASLTAGIASAVAVGGITGLGTGVGTFLATPSSANLKSAVTDETGSGALVFGTSPTINSKTVFSPTAGTAQASTSGTSIDFTGIPAGVTRVTVVFSAVSTNGTTNIIVQIGDSGGIETSSYTSTGFTLGASPSSVSQTNGFLVRSSPTDGSSTNGRCVIENIDGTTWTGCCVSGNVVTHGAKTLSGVLDRVRVTTSVGADAFDAGTINIIYE